MVTLTRRIDRNWFDGRIGNRKGIFPVSYVDVVCEPGFTRSELERDCEIGCDRSDITFPRAAKSPKPVSAPAAHSLLKDGAPLSNYVPPELNINAPFREQQQQRSSTTQDFSQSASTTTKTTRITVSRGRANRL